MSKTEGSFEHIDTYSIGGIGILHHYLTKMGIHRLIDKALGVEKNWQGSSVGITIEVFLIYLLLNPRAIYNAENWVQQTPYLLTFYPNLRSNCLTDDRIGNALDKLNTYGVERLYGDISVAVIQEFKLQLALIHFDLSNFGLYGDYTNSQPSDPFKITYGFSKKGRSDLKQVSIGVAVTGDGGVPIGLKTYDGNQADSPTYLPFWKTLKENLQTSDFLYIGDRKLITLETMLRIHEAGGFFLGPVSHYPTQDDQLRVWLKTKPAVTILKKEQKGDIESILYTGFEQKIEIKDPQTSKTVEVRYFVVHSAALEATKNKAIDHRIQKTETAFAELAPKLNHRHLKTESAIVKAIETILTANQANNWFDWQLHATETILQKQIGSGKPSPKTQYETVKTVQYAFSFQRKPEVVAAQKLVSPYYMLVSNQSAEKLSLVEAFEGYKQEYKVENVFRRMNNDTFQTVPMYLQRPERINAMLLLILIAVQAFTLIDRQAAQFIETSKKPICGLFPNKIRTFRPKAEQILKAFDNIQLIVLQTEGGTHHWVTTLSPLQQQLIQLLDIPPLYYQSQYIVPRLQKRIQSFVAT